MAWIANCIVPDAEFNIDLHLLCQKSQKNRNFFPINLCQGAIQTWGLQPLNYYGWGPFFRLFYMVSFLWLFTPSKSWDNDPNLGLNFSLCYKLQLCFMFEAHNPTFTTRKWAR